LLKFVSLSESTESYVRNTIPHGLIVLKFAAIGLHFGNIWTSP